MVTQLYIPVIFGVSLEVYFILLLIGIPTFFFWRWLFKKRIKDDKRRRLFTWGATVIGSPLIYFGISMMVIYSITYYPKYSFDKNKWMNDKEERYELSGDLIKSKMLLGKTKQEVIQLLGDEGKTNDENTWNYKLGFRPELFNIDPDYLEIEFKDNMVVEVIQHER